MKEEYKELYLQHGGLMKAALEKTVCYLNAIGRLNREENVREETLNVFRLSCCTWYSLLENSVIQRELFRAESQTERTYSIRRLMVTMYEMNKHMFGVEAKTVARVGKRCVGRVKYLEKGNIQISDCIYGVTVPKGYIEDFKTYFNSKEYSDFIKVVARGVCSLYICRGDLESMLLRKIEDFRKKRQIG